MFGFLLAILTFYILSIWYFNNLESQILEEQSSATENLISVYLENEDGDYVLSETTNFDQGTEYVYNEEKSYCVNESVLSYNEETSKISVTADGSDSCYVYFELIKFNTFITIVDYSGYLNIEFYVNGYLVDTSSGVIECNIGDVITIFDYSFYFALFRIYEDNIFSYAQYDNLEYVVPDSDVTIYIYEEN